MKLEEKKKQKMDTWLLRAMTNIAVTILLKQIGIKHILKADRLTAVYSFNHN